MPVLYFLILSSQVFGSEVPAVFTNSAPRIDGILDDAAWENASVITNLVQRLPNTGEPVSEPTEILILYDNNFIYIGMRCADDPKKITSNELARDVSLGNDDRVQVIFDTFLDHRNGYEI